MPTDAPMVAKSLIAPEIAVNRAFLWRISIIGSLAGLLFGYDSGIIDSASPFFSEQFQITDFLGEVIVSVLLVGVMIGCIFGGMIADRIGRKATLLWGALIFIAGSMIAQFAMSVSTLMIARFVLGLSIGITSVTAPVYLSELAPPKSRGKLIGLYQLMLTLGIALSNVVGRIFAETSNWHAMFGVGAVPALVLLLLTFTLPESPRWLCAKGRFEQATRILYSYTDAAGTAYFLDEIRGALSSAVQTKWSALFDAKVRPYFFIAAGFLMLLAVTGINAVIYYGVPIFKFAGVAENKAAIEFNLLVTTLNVVATIVGLALIDRVGRKPLLYVGLSGMSVALFVLAGAFFAKDSIGPKTLGITALSCLAAYITCFGFSLGVISWVIAAEVFPLTVRGRGIAAASTAYGIVNLIVTLTFITLVNAMGAGGTFAMYGGFCLITLLFVKLVVPETKGVELEEISKSVALPSV